MTEGKYNSARGLPLVLSAVLFLLLCLNLFRHISYPLLWNDESYGAMNAVRILEYGYPKVHDDRGNTVFEPPKGYDLELAYSEQGDIQTYFPWGNDYFSVIGVFLSRFANDIYQKTALVRIPFALAALAAILLMMFAIRRLFVDASHYLWVVVCFILMEILSVPFVLHMREARYYSVMVLLQAVIVYIFINHRIAGKKEPGWGYYVGTAFLFFISYHISYPLFYILAASWGVAHTFFLVMSRDLRLHRPGKDDVKRFILDLSPIALSILFILPFELLIFKTYRTAQQLGGTEIFSLRYLGTVGRILNALFMYEWLSVALIPKAGFVALFFFRRQLNEALRNEYSRLFFVSLFLNSIFLIALLSISRSSLVVFSRYVLPFQPVMLLAAVLEGSFFLKWLFASAAMPKIIRWGTVALLLLAAAFTVNMQLPMLRGRIHELRYPYRGPLDFIIPYIKNAYRDPSKLVIAADYESTSYMFYLNARILIGFIPVHLEEDLRHSPDILIYRKLWGQDQTPFRLFLSKDKYSEIAFPVLDYPVNNIPELYLGVGDDMFSHHFSTVYTNDPIYQTSIYIKLGGK